MGRRGQPAARRGEADHMSDAAAPSAEAPDVLGADGHIHHIALSVANVKETAAWYKEKLGFRERRRVDLRGPDGTVSDFMVLLEAGTCFVELMQIPGSAENPHAFVRF